jgi:hypothetical protein
LNSRATVTTPSLGDSRKLIESKFRNLRRATGAGECAMNRIGDYLNFSISFSGLGYIGMWPLSTPDAHGHLFGAEFICRDDGFVLLDVVCRLPHPLQMSPALHLLGLLAAAYVAVRLSWRALRALLRARRRRSASLDAAQVAARLPAIKRAP